MPERKVTVWGPGTNIPYRAQEMEKQGWRMVGQELGPNGSSRYTWVRYSASELRKMNRRRWPYVTIAILAVCWILSVLPASAQGVGGLIAVVAGIAYLWHSLSRGRCQQCGHIPNFGQLGFPVCERCGHQKRT